jgi:hypothetical protein
VAGYGKPSGTTPAAIFTIDKMGLAIGKIDPGSPGDVLPTRKGFFTIVLTFPAIAWKHPAVSKSDPENPTHFFRHEQIKNH